MRTRKADSVDSRLDAYGSTVKDRGGGRKSSRSRAARGDAQGSIGTSLVCPVSTKGRANRRDRELETSLCKEVRSFEDDEGEEAEGETVEEIAAAAATEAPDATTEGILPERPTDLAILVALAALLLKALEGRGTEIQADALVAFGVACGLLGYQLGRAAAAGPAADLREHSTRMLDERSELDSTDRSELDSTLRSRTDAAPDARPPLHEVQSLRLLQQSLRRSMIGGGDRAVEKRKPVAVPAKTFAKFPDGASVGSHLNCWSSPASTHFQVRGANYFNDKRKVPSEDYLLPCRGCDLFLTDNAPENLGRNKSILEGKLRDVPTFVVNYRLPWGVFLSYHEIPARFLPFLRRAHGHGDLSSPLPSLATVPAGERALYNFFLADASEKNQVLKIVPMVVDGPWMVKRVVGGKPALVGQKLPITYTYQPPDGPLAEYLEADLDIVSSAAARNILAVVRSYTQVLTIDLGYVVQGNRAEELPEQMMLGLRLHGLDPLSAELLPEFDDGRRDGLAPDMDTGYDTE